MKFGCVDDAALVSIIRGRAARDHQTWTFRCPSGSYAGVAEVSEADHPYMRSSNFTVDRLPANFIVTRAAEYREDPEVQCRCGMALMP